MTALSEFPWETFSRTFRLLRGYFFTKERHETDCYVVEEDIEEVEKELGKLSFAPNWEFSYNYRGEDLNLARVTHREIVEFPEVEWWQVHVRGFEVEDGVELQAHWEPEPTESGSAHLDGIGFDRDHGMKLFGEFLEETDLTIVERPKEK